MSVLLYRIDDRLIHGQVIIGWGRPLGIDYILLVDDDVRASPWEQDLYRMGVPAGIDVIFASTAEAVDRMAGLVAGEPRGIVLAGEIRTIVDLASAGVPIGQVNLGGIHHKPGRTERLPYLYLSDEELVTLRNLEATGVDVTAQDLPTAQPVPLRALA
jgi:PTS system mannose-specific IIB component/fructoselysine and glucoselysine-specific PTS system IIB component